MMRLKQYVKRILLNAGVLRLKQMTRPRSAVILYYHSVSKDRMGQAPWITPAITIDAEQFREHMRLLRKNYNPVTVGEIAEWVRGKQTLPPKSVAVSFDDGFLDNAELAAPIMEEFGIRGTFYLTVDCIMRQELPWFCKIHNLFHQADLEKRVLHDAESGQTWDFADPKQRRAAFLHFSYPCAKYSGEVLSRRIKEIEMLFGYRCDSEIAPKMMSFEQARELRRRGHIIGCHSFSHGNMAHIPVESLNREIVDAANILAKELGKPVKHFSYPHPCLDTQWNEESLKITRQYGFESAVLTHFGIITTKSDPMLLNRISIGNFDVDSLLWKLEMAFAGIKT